MIRKLGAKRSWGHPRSAQHLGVKAVTTNDLLKLSSNESRRDLVIGLELMSHPTGLPHCNHFPGSVCTVGSSLHLLMELEGQILTTSKCLVLLSRPACSSLRLLHPLPPLPSPDMNKNGEVPTRSEKVLTAWATSCHGLFIRKLSEARLPPVKFWVASCRMKRLQKVLTYPGKPQAIHTQTGGKGWKSYGHRAIPFASSKTLSSDSHHPVSSLNSTSGCPMTSPSEKPQNLLFDSTFAQPSH